MHLHFSSLQFLTASLWKKISFHIWTSLGTWTLYMFFLFRYLAPTEWARMSAWGHETKSSPHTNIGVTCQRGMASPLWRQREQLDLKIPHCVHGQCTDCKKICTTAAPEQPQQAPLWHMWIERKSQSLNNFGPSRRSTQSLLRERLPALTHRRNRKLQIVVLNSQNSKFSVQDIRGLSHHTAHFSLLWHLMMLLC